MSDHKLVSTVEFKINYLKPAYLHDKLKGVGMVLHHGKRLYTVEGQIFNHKQELLAKGIATLNAYPYAKSDMKFL